MTVDSSHLVPPVTARRPVPDGSRRVPRLRHVVLPRQSRCGDGQNASTRVAERPYHSRGGKALDDPDEISRLRRTIALARYYLDRFADPESPVWRSAGRSPHEFARDALARLDIEQTTTEPPDEEPLDLASGTGRIGRLSRARAGFVELRRRSATEALGSGAIDRARAALRVLRPTDFTCEPDEASALLGALRDSRTSDAEITRVASRLLGLIPGADAGGAG